MSDSQGDKDKVTTKKVTTNFLWRFLERTGAEAVTFIVSIVLARLLDPVTYGTVALVTVFTSLLQVFVDSGLGTALIQKKDADHLDFSTVFYFNLVVCLILYAVMFFAAPGIAKFYKRPELVSVIRVLSLILVISGFKNIQQAYVSRNLMFKKFFFATLVGTIGAAVVGITLAYKGFGVWALVAQMLFNAGVDTILLWITVKWYPKFEFSFERLKSLFSYGWKLLLSALLDKLTVDLRHLIIGKMYSSEDLAFYTKGALFPKAVVTNINTSIDSVLLPTMSKKQDNVAKLREMTRTAIKVSTFIMMPCMVGLAVCAEQIVSIILTDKWLPSVPYLRIFCFTYAFYPIHTANLNAIKALGRSDLFLKLEIIKKIVSFAALFATMRFGVMPMAYSLLVTSVLNQIINSWPNKKLLDYHYLDQVKDMLPQIFISIVMGIIVYCVKYLRLSKGITLLIQIPVGIILYITLSKIFKIDTYKYIINTVKSFISKRK